MALALALTFQACAAPEAEQAAAAPSPKAPSASSAPSFVNRVWEVRSSSAVAPGTLYVFLSEGTLVIASSRSTPSFGKWTWKDGKLTMIEESIPHEVEILDLKPDRFAIRIHDPGEGVEMELVPAGPGGQ
jgi:hypothetical protein